MTDQEITDYLFLEDSDQHGDLALVFGIRDWWDPLEKALELYKNKLVSKLLFTGGVNSASGDDEARNMYAEALKRGVPEGDLLLEDQASNTLENVLFAKKIIEKKIGWDNVHTICGVMANLHARRALMTMRRHFPEHINLKACPYEYKAFALNKDNWTETEKNRARVLSEIEKIPLYLAKGDIAEIDQVERL